MKHQDKLKLERDGNEVLSKSSLKIFIFRCLAFSLVNVT